MHITRPPMTEPPKKCRVYHENDIVAMSLADTFQVLGIYCEYTETQFIFRCLDTDREIESFARIAMEATGHKTKGIFNTPWECLRNAGLLERSHFYQRARDYLKAKRTRTTRQRKDTKQ